MPYPSHRLDLLIVAARPDQPVDVARIHALFERWGLNDQGRSDDLESIIEGGCARVWLDQPGRILLYANQTGGFRVRCPGCSTNLAGPFGVAHRGWKRGGPREVACMACQTTHALEDVVLQPPGAFSSWAIVFSAVNRTTLPPDTLMAIEDAVGEHCVIVRRP